MRQNPAVQVKQLISIEMPSRIYAEPPIPTHVGMCAELYTKSMRQVKSSMCMRVCVRMDECGGVGQTHMRKNLYDLRLCVLAYRGNQHSASAAVVDVRKAKDKHAQK